MSHHLLIPCIAAIAWSYALLAGDVTVKKQEVVTYFAPSALIEQRLCDEIHSEVAWIRVQAYAITRTPILDALIVAKSRGVDVQIIADAKWQTDSAASAKPVADMLKAAGIPLLLDSKHPIAHAKFVVFGTLPLVEAGSYNYTAQARSNHETALFILDALTHDQFLIDWNNHQKHSVQAP